MFVLSPSTTIQLLLLLPAAAVSSAAVSGEWDSLHAKLAERVLQSTTDHAPSRRVLFDDSPRQYTKPYQSDMASFADGENTGCDTAFFKCLESDACTECFLALKKYDIDWAGVTSGTECKTVISSLEENEEHKYCESLGAFDSVDATLFCSTFHSCVYFEEDKEEGDKNRVDCENLTECDWPGIRKSYLGDGVCHNNYHGECYNSKICNYDGGDCCQDTCKTAKDSYLECGTEGYICRDPKSTKCDPTATIHCPPSDDDDDSEDELPECSEEESLYKLKMFDSFGDGWEGTNITIRGTADDVEKTDPVFEGALESGFEGKAFMCLSMDAKCYDVETSGGAWGREVSWTLSGASHGAPSIASGGGQTKCEFPVGGDKCQDSCLGKNNKDPTDDPEYKEFKDMYHCIDKKCAIQSKNCKEDPRCLGCFDDDIPDYCYSIDSFTAVTDCTVCKCSEMENNLFCQTKSAPGFVPSTKKDTAKPCSPHETSVGGESVIEFNKCMVDYDQTSMLMTDFDQNKFGGLDKFEACAHAYSNRDAHGDHKALDCVKLLVDTMTPEKDTPNDVISQLAKLVYKDGEMFCNCSKEASDKAPLCPSFYNFKTLLYESLDACRALDEIDCAAWGEFHVGCAPGFKDKFGSLDFSKQEQCTYLEDGCGSVGPLPTFRRLDCASELTDPSSWEFYENYSKFCLKSGAKSTPAPTPSRQDKPETKHPTPNDAVNPSKIKPTAYIPEKDDDGVPTYTSPDSKKKSHWFRNLCLFGFVGGVGFYIYKRRADGFNFIRYRRVSLFGGGGGSNFDDGDMYSGFALESSTTFEPPSLPPTPMSMPNNGGYGFAGYSGPGYSG